MPIEIKPGRTRDMILMALFAGATAVLSQFNIPLLFTPIPINLATFAVFTAGGLLGARSGSLSMLIFLLMGIVGLPVFSNFGSGISKLLGPTGGYIIGYVAAAFMTGLVKKIKEDNIIWLVFSMTAGMTVCYIFGTVWFAYSTAADFFSALLLCVVPFILGDVIKIILSAIIVKRLTYQNRLLIRS